MKRSIITVIVAFLLSSVVAEGQSYIHVNGSGNYWRHTDLVGAGIGFGYSYEFGDCRIALNYEYGYGSTNRIDKIKDVNYEDWTTVFIKTEQGKWNEYLGFIGSEPTDLSGSSDYGKQHQVSLQIGYKLIRRENSDLVLSVGAFAANVEHFYTFTVVPVNYIEIPLFYRGPLNYIPSTSQKIYTYGANLEVAYDMDWSKKRLSPYLVVGLGPKYSSYVTIGLRMSTALTKK